MNPPQSLIQRASTQVPTQVPFVPFVFTFLPRQAAEPPLSPGSLLHALNFNMSDYMSDLHVLGTPGAPPCRAKPLNLHSPPGSLLYVLYVLYLTRQAAEPPLSPGSLLYVLYALYLTRQAAEPPLSPGSLLYVLYVLYLTRQAAEPPLSPGSLLYVLYVLYTLYARNLYYMCYIGPYSTYSTYSKEPGKSGCSVACLVRYSTYSTYSKEPEESGCSVACLVRYST